MTRFFALIILCSIAACGDATSPLSLSVRQQIFETERNIPYGKLLEATPNEVVETFDFDILYVDIPQRQQETVMRPFATNAQVTTWVGANKTSLYVQDEGIVVGTRGYGDDLAASRRPSWDDLIEFAQTHQGYTSTYRHWDADEKLVTLSFDCNSDIQGNALIETCSDQQIYFQNTYAISEDLEPTGLSNQWVSRSIGSIKLMRLN